VILEGRHLESVLIRPPRFLFWNATLFSGILLRSFRIRYVSYSHVIDSSCYLYECNRPPFRSQLCTTDVFNMFYVQIGYSKGTVSRPFWAVRFISETAEQVSTKFGVYFTLCWNWTLWIFSRMSCHTVSCIVPYKI